MNTFISQSNKHNLLQTQTDTTCSNVAADIIEGQSLKTTVYI